MAKIKTTIPNIAHIVITGPTQCGKSIVLERISQILRDEFGAWIINLEGQKNAPPDLDKLQPWELDTVRKTTWVLSEGDSELVP